MRQDVQNDLIRRILRLLAEDEKDVIDREHRLPIERYVDPQRYADELAMLGQTPLAVGRSEALAKPGDFFTLEVGAVPIVVTRSDDGSINALVNVCRHRGTRVVQSPSGCKKKLVCPYHAWTYELDGRLSRVTDESGFSGVDRATHGLVRLPTTERHGFVWVVPAPDARSRDVGSFLDTLDDDFAGFELAEHVVWEPRKWRWQMNWKLAIDIFLEAYHVRYVHARSIYEYFFDNVALFEQHGPHQRNIFPKRTIRELAEAPEDAWELRAHGNVFYALFPNTALLVQPDHVSVFHVYPDGTDACDIDHYTLLSEAPTTDAARTYWGKNLAILHGAVDEDRVMGESIQRGLRSGANSHLTFGRFEQSLAWYHDAVDRAVDTR